MNNRTKLFLDTEFTGLHQGTTLISLAIVSEHGDMFYAEFSDFDKSQINEWLVENVIRQTEFVKYNPLSTINNSISQRFINGSKHPVLTVYGESGYIQQELINWLKKFENVEIWSDCLAYDWVLLCQLWGGAINMPEKIYYIPFDICTLFLACGIDPDTKRTDFVREELGPDGIMQHHSLNDAIVIQLCYNKLIKQLNPKN